MKKAANIKTGLFAFIFMMLLLPALQKTISIFPVKPLEGSFDLAEKPQFSWKAWISGSYQEQYTRYLEDHIGFRNLLVRIRNQISFSLYNKTLAQNVAIGKEGVLYQDFVIEAMLGQDFIGETALRTNAEKLKFIQDTLHKKNIELVFVIAPGKSSVLPEYIPESYDLTTNRPSNYDVWTKFLNQLDVRFLDLKSYFLAIKDTCRYPLFPRCGTHWSGYGVTLAADTMFRYLESRLGYDIPGFISDQGILTSTDLRFTDDDISKGMNLLWSPA
ncbi:MAG: hypothetical protein KKA07_06810, partial [Bacteroidetes bacterium]|nr:hypothetical protein [Bacteroidota bacterium]